MSVTIAPPSRIPGSQTVPPTCIFAVDDDTATAERLTVELEAAGYDIRVFSGIGAAMAHLPAAQPALLIVGLNLPKMGGLAVLLPALRSNGLGAGTQVLVLSRIEQADRRDETLRAGAGDYLVKPVTGAELRAAVSRLLSARPAAATGDQINDVVADLTRTYGRPTVSHLLRTLSADLCRLQFEMPCGRDEIEQQAHAVKGAAGSLGFVAVANACGALEHACQVGEGIETLLRQATHACASAREAIDRHLRTAA
jgi:DNA-binding response OmpR family regulator